MWAVFLYSKRPVGLGGSFYLDAGVAVRPSVHTFLRVPLLKHSILWNALRAILTEVLFLTAPVPLFNLQRDTHDHVELAPSYQQTQNIPKITTSTLSKAG